MKTRIGVLVRSYAGRVIRLIVVLSFLGAAWGTSVARSPQDAAMSGPSFSCGSAGTAIETMICNDPALAARDRTMAVLFAASRADAFDQGMSQQQTVQRQWLKTRNEQCSKGDMRSCLVNAYDERLNELAIAALFQAQDAALAELTRQNPRSAPLYDAIYRYATIEDTVDRAKVAARLIGPAFAEFHNKPWAHPLSGVKDAYEAASSDKRFSLFLDVASVSNYELTMPCSALVRRPGLTDALDAVYGGAIDGQLIRSDCEGMTPRLQTLDRLAKAAVAAQSFCPGTIRFSLGRDFDKILVAVRLHRTDLWKPEELSVGPGSEDEKSEVPEKQVDEPQFVAKHQALIRDATDELMTYYSRHFGVPPALAKEQALGAVGAIISGAYNLCEMG